MVKKKAGKKVAKKTPAKKAAPKKAARKKAAVPPPVPVLNVHAIARGFAQANAAPAVPQNQFGGVCYVPNAVSGTPHPEVTRDQCDLIGEWVETPQAAVVDPQRIARGFAMANMAPPITAAQVGTCWIPRRVGGTPHPGVTQDQCENLLGGEWGN